MRVTSSDSRGAVSLLAAALAAFAVSASAVSAGAVQRAFERREAYDAVERKSIIDLQMYRSETEAVLPDATPVSFMSLNPTINAWFLLGLGAEGNRRYYHLENIDPEDQNLTLEAGDDPALVITGAHGATRCTPWDGALDTARQSGLPFAPVCDDRLYLRNPATGASTNLERTTDFLRDHVWGGEQVVRFIRDNFFKDSYAETSERLGTDGGEVPERGPTPLPLNVPDESRPVISTRHEFGLEGADPGRMTMGIWYPVSNLDGVYASTFQPGSISRDILNGPGRANRLDGYEARSTGYMVAFDLARYDIGFAKGTDHPRLDWSPRPPWSVKVQGLPGPDGFASPDPVVPLGMVNPTDAARTVGTFTAGYKRSHGAFKWGPFSTVNFGSHYGFLEQGTIYSKLWPGLATLFVLDDGSVHMRTWTEEDAGLLPRLRFARQNGVALVEPDPETGRPVPGRYVTQWGPGNWSGSAEAELRTLRAGACLMETDQTRYLVYGFFSTATPSAMARTFQGYGCQYAMLLDMNAPTLTYLALYVRRSGSVHVEHLTPEMTEVDKRDRQGNVIPRFIGFPDNRDLFYVMRKEDAE